MAPPPSSYGGAAPFLPLFLVASDHITPFPHDTTTPSPCEYNNYLLK